MTAKIVSYEDAKQVEPMLEQIVDIYREAFGQAPYFKDDYEVRSFARVLPQHIQRAGFRCVIAQDENSQAILGFAYGYTGADGQWWHNLVLRDMNDEDAALWMSDVFEVVELAVRHAQQGHGYGSLLHDALLEGRPHHTAALSTYDVETTALKLYERRGWVTLLRDFLFPGYSEPYRIMGKKLR